MAAITVIDEPLERGVARVVELHDAGRRNALTPQLLTDLHGVLDALQGDPEIAALILTHTGSTFCAGTDLDALQQVLEDEAQLRDFLARIVRLFRRIERAHVPTVAAIDGAAVGGGFELALACDLRVLSGRSWVSLPEVTLGAVPGGGGAHRLPRLIGRSRTLELVLRGERLTAETCASLGLCGWLSPEPVLDQALAIATELSTRSRPAMAAIKRLVLAGEELLPEAADRYAVEAMVARLRATDGREGLAALAERRKPRFSEPAGLDIDP